MSKIFISHSSRADPFAAWVREAVKGGLAGHEVLIDMDVLRPGDEWCAVLYHWLAECHAAVVLLNREALGSTWVRREVNILLWRRALGSPLEVVPAIIGDLSTEDIESAGFGELEPLQMARLGQVKRTPEAAGRLAATIVGRLAGLPAGEDKSPMAKWTKAVSEALRKVENRDSLVDAAQELLVEETYLDQVRDPVVGCTFLAHQLLAQGHGRRLYLAIAQMADFTPVEWLSRLIDKVGATWVDGEAARALLAFGAGRPGIVALNARRVRTAQQYVDRATCYAETGFEYETVPAVAGEFFLEEFMSECERAVEKLWGLEPPDTVEDIPPGQMPVDVLFLIVDPGATRRDLVAQGMRAVLGRFPWLIMVLLTGEQLPTDAELAAWQLTDVLKLEPALGPEEEFNARHVIGLLRRLLTKVRGGLMVGAG